LHYYNASGYKTRKWGGIVLRWINYACALLAACSGAPAFAQTLAPTASPAFIAPYLWAMNISGSIGLDGLSVPVNLASYQLARGVKAGGMGYAQYPVGDNFVYLDGLGVSFGERHFQTFFGQNLNAGLAMGDAGLGRNFMVDPAIPVVGRGVISPYVGARILTLTARVDGPQLRQRFSKNWYQPVLGVLVQGPLAPRFSYVVKLDAGGFNVNDSRYRSAIVVLRYTITRNWSVAGGYRAADFYSGGASAAGLSLNLAGAGPLVGVQLSF